ncbi:MAG: curlin [Rhodobacteraceae bacterium]|nr:curlin [Paracoccaceae bacterium]
MKRFILSATLAAFTALPALAGGSISIEIAPSNTDEANAIRAGLAIYSIAQALEGDANILQNGNGNGAGIGQFGDGNFGVIQQEGDGHNATLAQNGDNNAFGVFQFGEGTDAAVAQSGGGTGLLFQFGF